MALLTVASNLMPMVWWTPVSEEPFRLLIAMDRKNHALSLLRGHWEAVLNFLPWSECEPLVHAGYLAGRKVKKAERLGFHLLPARQPKDTEVVEGVYAAFELTVVSALEEPAGEHAPSYAMPSMCIGIGARPSVSLSCFRGIATSQHWASAGI